MPRRNRPERRVIKPDVRYNSVEVASFINRVMKGGKKSTATRQIYARDGVNRGADKEEWPGSF